MNSSGETCTGRRPKWIRMSYQALAAVILWGGSAAVLVPFRWAIPDTLEGLLAGEPLPLVTTWLVAICPVLPVIPLLFLLTFVAALALDAKKLNKIVLVLLVLHLVFMHFVLWAGWEPMMHVMWRLGGVQP